MTTDRTPQLDPTDIKLLRVFVKIVECGGFAAAQAELNISPSTISTQVAKLETRLGMRLCQRGRVGFRLTDKGRRVHQAATRLFSAIEDFRSDVGEVRGKLAGSFRIGVVDTTVSNPEAGVARAIARFSERDHAVHITLHISEPATLERWLLDDRIDVGISAFYHHVPGLNYEPIFTEEHGLFCGRDHLLFAAAGGARSAADPRGGLRHARLHPPAPRQPAPGDARRRHRLRHGGDRHPGPLRRLHRPPADPLRGAVGGARRDGRAAARPVPLPLAVRGRDAARREPPARARRLPGGSPPVPRRKPA